MSITLSPAGRRIDVAAGTRLQDVLFAQGVEFPCGGRGRCGGCRVKVLQGWLEATAEEKTVLGDGAVAAGWRLACRHIADGALTLELAQWQMPVLGDDTQFAFTPQSGFGMAVDLGTTTLAVQLLDLASGQVLAVKTALNAQARHGADVMSRVAYALQGGQEELQRLIREQIGALIAEMPGPLRRVVLVGNSVMHHLFCGIDVAPLATHPFLPREPGRVTLPPEVLGLAAETEVVFLPCIGGLVGADILAGVIASGLHRREELSALIDLGTNGEVVVGRGGHLLCTSTAAGPAFEGARIAMGMRAATGAIDAVELREGALSCRVIGGGAARGICGSGLVDAVAAGLELGAIAPGGRLASAMGLADGVTLSPQDVRELQLAKGAIAAGLRMLAARFGAKPGEITRLYLAGAFGNSIARTGARRIGLLRLDEDRIVPAGNTALQGAKRALFADLRDWDALAARIEPVALNEEAAFAEVFAEEMAFPG
jgi:uncharacterized 2Fe-2S/4Fe-4S cluster protein (DUF4445 family)